MKKKLAFCILGIALLSGCQGTTDIKPTAIESSIKPMSMEVSNYTEYKNMYLNMAKNLKLDGFEKVEDYSSISKLVMIDKDISFDKRSNLTLSGEKNPVDSTQQRIVFKDKKNKLAIFIDVIYINGDVGEDLLYSDVGVEKKENDQPAFRNYRTDILGYHNSIIKISTYNIDTSPADAKYMIEETNKIDKIIVKFLKDNGTDK